MTNLVGFFVLFILYFVSHQATALKLSNSLDTVCENVTLSMSTANVEAKLANLQRCHIIEGNLLLNGLYIKSNTSFTNLKQVTGYVVLHYVRGFVTLAQLFPQLVVIRGQELFHDYGLILIGNSDLQEVGPWNFHGLMRGAVGIEDNVVMCAEPLSQWTTYTSAAYRPKNYFKNNFNECPFANCEAENYCTVRAKTCERTQQKCFQDIGCHSECIGGCREPNNKRSCAACKNLSYRGECVKICPANHYKYLNYSCITKMDCTTHTWKTFEPASTNRMDHHLGPDNLTEVNKKEAPPKERTCVRKCPNGQKGLCDGKDIAATCEGAVITRENMGEKFRHCSIIDGSLTIMVTGGKNISPQLRENFGNITKITGYLSITAANSLYSLSFFSSLESIEGKETKYEGCTFCVLQNANLEEFWVWENRKSILNIKGKIYIRFNGHLPEQEIARLISNTNSRNSSDIEDRTNGMDVPKKIFYTKMIAVPNSEPGTAVLTWYHKYGGIDNRYLIGYHIYYLATNKNITIFEDRDACTDHGLTWKRKTVERHVLAPPFENEDDMCMTPFVLDKLQPNTRYAVYARLFAMSGEQFGIYTSLSYVTTSRIYPKKPQNGDFNRISSNSFALTWDKPVVGSTDVKYEVTVTIQKKKNFLVDSNLKFEGNYLTFVEALGSSLPPAIEREPQKSPSVDVRPQPDKSSCSCDSHFDEALASKRNAELIAVSNAIQNLHVYKIREEEAGHETTEPPQPRKSFTTNGKPVKLVKTSKSYECSEPDIDWINSTLKMEEVLQPTDWILNGNRYKIILRSEENRLNITLPAEFEKVKIMKIKMDIRAFVSEQNPCQVSKNYASCALISKTSSHTESIIAKDELTDFEITYDILSPFANYNIGIDCKTSNLSMQTFDDRPINMSMASDDPGLEIKVSWKNPSMSIRDQILGYCVQVYYMKPSLPGKFSETCFSRNSSAKKGNQLLISVKRDKPYMIRFLVATTAGFIHLDSKCVQMNKFNMINVVLAITVGFLVVIALCIVWYFVKTLLDKPVLKSRENLDYGIMDAIKTELDKIPESLKLDRNQLMDLKKLNEGASGVVYKARLCRNDASEEVVAVKTTKNYDSDNYIREFNNLLQDVKILTGLHSPFILKLLGICKVEIRNGAQCYVVLEYMDQMDLKTYLSNIDGEQYLTEEQMVEILVQIAAGMSYLAESKIVHRDLAARNIMVDTRGIGPLNPSVKVGDFGLGRFTENGYYVRNRQSNSKLPVRWMAPESLKYDRYQDKSDVWSFGIIIWEVLTRCRSRPYENIAKEEDIYEKFKKGEILKLQPIPKDSSIFLKKQMEMCFADKASERPDFRTLTKNLLDKTSIKFQQKFWSLPFDTKKRNRDSESTEGVDEGCCLGTNSSLDDEDDESTRCLISSGINDDCSFQEYSHRKSYASSSNSGHGGHSTCAGGKRMSASEEYINS